MVSEFGTVLKRTIKVCSVCKDNITDMICLQCGIKFKFKDKILDFYDSGSNEHIHYHKDCAIL